MQNIIPSIPIALLAFGLIGASLVIVTSWKINKKLLFILLLVLTEFFLNLLVSQSISQLNYFDFYRYDAKFLVCFGFLIFGYLLSKLSFTLDGVKKNIYISSFVSMSVGLVLYLPYFGNEFIGLYNSHNASAGLLAAIIILLIHDNDSSSMYKRLLLIFFGLLFIFAQSRAMLLGLFTSLLYLSYYKGWIKINKNTILLIFTALIIFSLLFIFTGFFDRILYAFSGEDYNVNTRFLYWQKGLDLFINSPWFGHGIGGFNDAGIYIKGVYVDDHATHNGYFFGEGHAHNLIIHVLAERGLIGLIFYIVIFKLMIGSIIGYNNKILIKSLFVLLLVASMFGLNLFTPSTAFIFYLLMGVLIGEKKLA